MIERRIARTLEKALSRSASVTLIGPRQVGKTTIAINIAESNNGLYLDLERSRDLQRIQDIDAFHSENRDRLIIMDEVQRLPDIFRDIRGIIDKERRRG